MTAAHLSLRTKTVLGVLLIESMLGLLWLWLGGGSREVAYAGSFTALGVQAPGLDFAGMTVLVAAGAAGARRVVQLACQKQLAAGRRRDLHLSVNLLGYEFNNLAMCRGIQDTIRETGVDPTRLTFEITETRALANVVEAERFIRELAELGCRSPSTTSARASPCSAT